MIVHRVVLPYERHGPDISWMRVPVLLLGLLVVAITQGAISRTLVTHARAASSQHLYVCV